MCPGVTLLLKRLTSLAVSLNHFFHGIKSQKCLQFHLLSFISVSRETFWMRPLDAPAIGRLVVVVAAAAAAAAAAGCCCCINNVFSLFNF